MTETEVWNEPPRGGYPHPGLLGLSGLERLRRFGGLDSPAPPLSHLTGAEPVRFGEGTAEAVMPASPWLSNAAGLVGGGTLAILADVAFGCSIETRIPPATPYTTAELSLTFLRPVHPGGQITAAGQALHLGRTVGLSEAFLLDESERLVAHGTSRLAILPAISDVPDLPADAEQAATPDHGTPDPYLREPVPGGLVPPESWAELSGAEVLAKQLDGDLPPPPIHYLTGMTLRAGGGGAAAMTMPASRWLTSPSGRLQGGTLAMLADAAMQAAVLSTATPATAIAGLDLKVNYLRPPVADERELTARAEVIHAGRTLAVTRCEVANADGKSLVLATGSSMYLRDRPASLEDAEFPEALED